MTPGFRPFTVSPLILLQGTKWNLITLKDLRVKNGGVLPLINRRTAKCRRKVNTRFNLTIIHIQCFLKQIGEKN